MIDTVGELLGWLKLETIPVLDLRIDDIICDDNSYPMRVSRIKKKPGMYMGRVTPLFWYYDDLENGSAVPEHHTVLIIPRAWVNAERIGR